MNIDASFRHRNGRAQGASTIQSVQRTSPSEKGRTIDVHDLVSISRRRTPDVPLAVVCAFARDGKRCFFHGTEEEWRRKVDHGTPEEKQLMLCGKCYSSATIRFPLAPQLAEAIGAHLICLRSQVLWDDSGPRSRLSYGEAISFVLQVDPRVLRSLPHPSEYYKSSLRAGTPVNNKTKRSK